jgi:hypothetical protein
LKTLLSTGSLYSALTEVTDRSGRAVQDIAVEAIEAWLADLEPDVEERQEIEIARAAADEKGGPNSRNFSPRCSASKADRGLLVAG